MILFSHVSFIHVTLKLDMGPVFPFALCTIQQVQISQDEGIYIFSNAGCLIKSWVNIQFELVTRISELARFTLKLGLAAGIGQCVIQEVTDAKRKTENMRLPWL